ncbi:MAG: NAD(P)/FAD-dependent oxidoreductase, partial [Candidatus Caldarchaeum sp.]|nr:NAD(P)/FAD-dependent oxidoreductase [Candidatus Caldarchaeum sp.]
DRVMSYDVAIVGGSSTGLVAARECAKRGLSTVAFEEDFIIGRPEKCAGLYSVEGLKSLDIPVQGPYLQNVVRGAVFVSPSGKSFMVDAGRDVAVVFNRERMDLFIAEQAAKAGAEIMIGTRVNEVSTNGAAASIKTSRNIHQSRYVIIAEGRGASVAKQIFTDYATGKWLPIIQYQISHHGQDPQFVYLYFRKYLREFFGYLVPIDDETGKFGVAASKFIYQYADKLLSEVFPRAKVTGMSSSSIYVGPPLGDIRRRNVMLVGEVAGQVKATTGGGVITGGMVAFAAAKHAAVEVVYYKHLRPLISELKGTYMIRRFYEKLSPKHIEAMVRAAAESGFSEKLGQVGDMDKHLTTLIKTAASTSFVKMAFSAIKHSMTTMHL